MTKDAESNTGREENRRQDRRHSRQKVCRAPPGHESATAAAHAERSAFGPLEENDHDHGSSNHDVNDKKNSGHRTLTGQILGKLPPYMTAFRRKIKMAKAWRRSSAVIDRRQHCPARAVWASWPLLSAFVLAAVIAQPLPCPQCPGPC